MSKKNKSANEFLVLFTLTLIAVIIAVFKRESTSIIQAYRLFVAFGGLVSTFSWLMAYLNTPPSYYRAISDPSQFIDDNWTYVLFSIFILLNGLVNIAIWILS